MESLYTRQQLETYTRTQLWIICESKSLNRFRSREDCIEAIIASQPQKVEVAEVKSEIVEESIDSHPVVIDDSVVAIIEYDNDSFVTQLFVVKVNGQELHRDTTFARSESWVRGRYKSGRLPVHNEQGTAQAELDIYVEEQAEAITQESIAPKTQAVKSEQLQKGNDLVIDDEVWTVRQIAGKQRTNKGIEFRFMLLPHGYQHNRALSQLEETRRLNQSVKWLSLLEGETVQVIARLSLVDLVKVSAPIAV